MTKLPHHGINPKNKTFATMSIKEVERLARKNAAGGNFQYRTKTKLSDEELHDADLDREFKEMAKKPHS